MIKATLQKHAAARRSARGSLPGGNVKDVFMRYASFDESGILFLSAKKCLARAISTPRRTMTSAPDGSAQT